MARRHETTYPVAALGKPADWRQPRWNAWIALQGGGTVPDAASASGTTKSTVHRWMRDWEVTFGPKVVRSPDGLQSSEGIKNLQDRRRARVSERREVLLEKCAENVERGTQLINSVLKRYANSPALLAMLSPSDLERVARVVKMQADVFSAIASDIADSDEQAAFPARGSARPQLEPADYLDALEPGADGEIDAILAGLDEAERRFAGAGEVIDIDGRVA